MSEPKPVVGIIMGSRSDWPTLKAAASVLDRLKVPYETKIVSAHRTPKRLYDYASSARKRGIKVIIAGAGGAAHLRGSLVPDEHQLLPEIQRPQGGDQFHSVRSPWLGADAGFVRARPGDG